MSGSDSSSEDDGVSTVKSTLLSFEQLMLQFINKFSTDEELKQVVNSVDDFGDAETRKPLLFLTVHIIHSADGGKTAEMKKMFNYITFCAPLSIDNFKLNDYLELGLLISCPEYEKELVEVEVESSCSGYSEEPERVPETDAQCWKRILLTTVERIKSELNDDEGVLSFSDSYY